MIEKALELLLWAVCDRAEPLDEDELTNAIIGIITLAKFEREQREQTRL
jgi:hypothetical protein